MTMAGGSQNHRQNSIYEGMRLCCSVKQKLPKMRVHLDWSLGETINSDPDSNTHLLTFPHTFTRRLFPFISTSPSEGTCDGQCHTRTTQLDVKTATDSNYEVVDTTHIEKYNV